MTGWLIGAGAALVVALIAAVAALAKRAGRREAERDQITRRVEAMTRATDELGRPRTRGDVVGKLRRRAF